MIIIEKDSITLEHLSGENEPITPSELPKYLGDKVTLGEEVTFKRIFELIIINRKIFDTVFGSVKGFYPIDVYIPEFLKNDDENDGHPLSYLEVYYGCDYHNATNSKKKMKYNVPPTFEFYTSIHGIDEKYTDEYQKEECTMPISLMFTRINVLKKYRLKINNEVVVYHMDYSLDNPKNVEILRGSRPMSLFEFFSGILGEITWSGSPKERDEKAEDLEKTVERIKSGEEEMHEWIFDEETGKHFLKDKDGNLKPFLEDEEE